MCLPRAALLGLVLVTVAAATGVLTPYSNCGYTGALVGLQLGECREWPCIFKRGVTAKWLIQLKAQEEYHTLKTTINALYGGVAIPLYVDEQVCSKLVVGKCPANIGDPLTYIANVTVAHSLPTISVTLEWRIADGNRKTVACAQVPAQFR